MISRLSEPIHVSGSIGLRCALSFSLADDYARASVLLSPCLANLADLEAQLAASLQELALIASRLLQCLGYPGVPLVQERFPGLLKPSAQERGSACLQFLSLFLCQLRLSKLLIRLLDGMSALAFLLFQLLLVALDFLKLAFELSNPVFLQFESLLHQLEPQLLHFDNQLRQR
jgi:hypothetical protein